MQEKNTKMRIQKQKQENEKSQDFQKIMNLEFVESQEFGNNK